MATKKERINPFKASKKNICFKRHVIIIEFVRRQNLFLKVARKVNIQVTSNDSAFNEFYVICTK